MILHDFTCLAHGAFESSKDAPDCPFGCSARLVRKIFLKPPAYHDGGTANIDKNLRNLAADFNLTDMNNQNGTAAATRIDWRKQREQDMMAGQTFALAMGEQVGQTMTQIGVAPDNSIDQVRDRLQPPRPLVEGSYGTAADVKKAMNQ